MSKVELKPIGVLLFFIGAFLVCYMIFSLIGIVVALGTEPGFNIEALKELGESSQLLSSKRNLIIIQVIGSLGGFLVPCLMVTRIFKGYGSRETMHTNPARPVAMVIAGTLIFYGALTATSLLHEINSLIPLSDAFKSLEAKNLAAQKTLIQGESFLDLTTALIVVALLPAFLEELFFRGVGMNLLDRVSGNKHVAVVIQGVFFGIIHFNAGQLLPIMGIGILFGYLAYETRSIWYTVLIHFLNNALAVIALFYKDKYSWAAKLNTEEAMPWWQYLIGLVVLFVGLYLYYRKTTTPPNPNTLTNSGTVVYE